jgi:hypothetical protein
MLKPMLLGPTKPLLAEPPLREDERQAALS